MPTEPIDVCEIARELLAGGRVEVVIGYAAATAPTWPSGARDSVEHPGIDSVEHPGIDSLRATPVFIRDPARCEVLIFDRTCENNLVNYLHRFKGTKVAIVAKGCDERSIVGLVQEKQIERENVVVLGAPCTGVIDPKRLQALLSEDILDSVVVQSDTVSVRTAAGEKKSVDIAELIYAGCRTCSVRNPRFAEFLIGPPVPQPEVPEIGPEVAEVEAQSCDERWGRFRAEMDKCILCFACRSLCPACYCRECFTESSRPKWMSKSSDPADAMFFHLARLNHLAGRCTGCGACVRGCPANVDLRLYNDKLRKDVKEVFGFDAGMNPEAELPMTSFRADDRNDFIM